MNKRDYLKARAKLKNRYYCWVEHLPTLSAWNHLLSTVYLGRFQYL